MPESFYNNYSSLLYSPISIHFVFVCCYTPVLSVYLPSQHKRELRSRHRKRECLYFFPADCPTEEMECDSSGFSSSSPCSDQFGAHPMSYLVGSRASFPRAKWPGYEADHLSPNSIRVKNVWSYTSAPSYIILAWCIIKHRDRLYLLVSSHS
jgi:hypothetical protein